MTQPIDRETAIALAKEAGMAGMLTDVVCSLEEIHRLCNLAIAHSRKDTEPVGYQYRMKPEWHDAWVKWQPCDKANFDDYVKAPVVNGWQFEARALFTHPPEADKLLQQALEALDGALSDDKPYIAECKGSATAIRTYLEGK
jgi:hypothetical protein